MFNYYAKKDRDNEIMTCSSLMRCWSLSLRKGPWRPPLRGLMKTIIGVDGATALWSSLLRMQRFSPAVGSLNMIESRIAKRRYFGIVSFFLSSSLSTRVPPEMPHPRNDSTIDDDDFIGTIVDDDGGSIVFALIQIRKKKTVESNALIFFVF